MNGEGCRKLTPERWLDALTDPRVEFVVRMFGYLTVPKTWRYENHIVPENIVYFVTRGCAMVQVAGADHRLGPGSFLSLSHGVRHAVWIPQVEEPITVYYLHFSLKRTHFLRPFDDVIVVERSSHLHDTFEQLYDERCAALPYRDYRSRMLLGMIFTSISRSMIDEESGLRTFDRNQRLEIARHIEGTVTRRTTAFELAAIVGLSPDYFSRVFRNTYGKAPKTWLMEERIRRSTTRLALSTESIERIATEFGYDDACLFCRQFKKVIGLSPARYRRLQSSGSADIHRRSRV